MSSAIDILEKKTWKPRQENCAWFWLFEQLWFSLSFFLVRTKADVSDALSL